jgi:hypothetical protein
MMLTRQLSEFLDSFHRQNGYVPTRLRITRGDFMVLCWENQAPHEAPPGFSHTFLGIVVSPKEDA